jgi:biopolymer transport protein ExbB
MELYEYVLDLWLAGGPLMIPLVLLALFIYWAAFELYFSFKKDNMLKVPDETWREWVKNPETGDGILGDTIRYGQDGVDSMRELRNRFDEIKLSHLPKVDRRIVFVTILVTIAPLMGLLGTVMGMLNTFRGLSIAAGRTIDLVASGISEALITTQTGLVIAIPGYILLYLVVRRRNKLETILSRLESETMLKLKRKQNVPAAS